MSGKVKNIFWVAGENSGDLHASIVIKALNKRGSNYRHLGIGGHRMQAQGFTPMFPFQKFSIMGFLEVLQSLPFIWHVEKEIKKFFAKIKPDLVVLVDYPGFNLRLARIAYDLDIPVLYFICPQFWAWRHGRVKQLKENTNFVASILPFEKESLDIHRVTSAYVGRPIAEEIQIEVGREQFANTFGLDPDKDWLGFMPGSRDSEIRKMLPPFIEAIRRFRTDEFQFLVSKAHTINHEMFMSYFPDKLLKRIFLIDGYMYEMIKYSRFMVVTSGTATLETAYIGTPFIIVYKSSWVSYSIARRLVRIKRIGLPNIILDNDIVPELIQDEVTGENIYTRILQYLDNSQEYDKMAAELGMIKELLSEKKASQEVASIIESIINEEK